MTEPRSFLPAHCVAAATAICLLVGGLGEQGRAQTVEWVRQLGTSDSDRAHHVSADVLGNVYITGQTWGSLGGPFRGGYGDAFVAKYDATGSHQWTRQLGTIGWDDGNDVSTDGLGNVYVAGTSNLFASLVKYDSAGVLQWTRQNMISDFGRGHGVSTDGLGYVYITGEIWHGSSNSETDAFVAKYDAAGSLQWSRQLGSTMVFVGSWGVSADGLGNVYITGYAFGDLDVPSTGEGHAFVAKYDAAGDLQWTRRVGSSDFIESLGGVSADDLGNVYFSGRTSGDLGGPFQGGVFDAFVAKYNADGDLQWTRQLGTSGHDESRGVAVDGLGNVYLSGSTSGDLGGPLVGDSDAFVAKYDAAGDLLWIHQLGTPTSGAASHGVAAGGLGNVYFSGWTTGDLGGPNAGGVDAFVAKIVDPNAVPGLPGDFDGNGLTDGGDFLAWQRGESPDPLSAADLAAWKANFGTGSLTSALRLPPSALNVVVPEPAGLALPAGPLALVALVRRQVCRRLVARRT